MRALPPPLPEILRDVSRSFHLSMRMLPAALRAPVAVAYLLARASDTLADTAAVTAQERLLALRAFGERLEPPPESLAARVTHPGEARLLRALPGVVEALGRLEAADRRDVRAVLAEIVSGQELDVARFPGRQLASLETTAEVDDYTQRVAGCVGDFWTRVGFRHLPNYAALPPAEMQRLGCSYGRGLQRINILRDAGDDLANGRCYFPADELAAAGLRPAQLAAAPGALAPLWSDWIAIAERAMDDGMRYALAVRSARIRVACALPALIGLQTLALLRAAGPQAIAHRVKVPRARVRGLLAGIALTLGGPGHLRSTYAALRENRTP